MKKVSFIFLGLIGMFILTLGTPVHANEIVTADQIKTHDLIQTEGISSVYYIGEDGMRYIFPDDSTFSTWYKNLDSVKFVSPEDLAQFQIGGVIPYKPGTRLIRLTGTSNVYAVAKNKTLRHLENTVATETIFGSSWGALIDDLPDVLFYSYKIGNPIEFASQYDRHVEQQDAMNISDELNLLPAYDLNILENGDYSEPTIHVPKNQPVRWTNTSLSPQTASDNDGLWGSGILWPGQNYTHYFVRPGIHFCHNRYNSNVGCAIYYAE